MAGRNDPVSVSCELIPTTPVPCDDMLMSASVVSLWIVFDLNTPETSMSVAFNSFVTPTISPPSTTLPDPFGVMFTLPFVSVAESVLPSALKLSTFSCPVVVCTPVAVIGPVNKIAPVP